MSFQAFLHQIAGDEDEIDVAIEDIERIFLFSPFDSMDEAGDILSKIPTRKELARARKIARIPSDLAELNKAISTLASEFEIAKKTPGNSANIDEFRVEVNNLKAEIEKFEKRCLVNEELGVSQHKAQTYALDMLNRGNEIFVKKFAANEARAVTLEKSATEIYAAFKALEDVVNGLRKKVSEHEKEREHRKTAEPEQNNAVLTAKMIGVEANRPSVGETVVKVANASELMTALASNFMAIGIADSAARKISVAVSIAVMSGQLVQFSGSLADMVADATLLAVGGDSYMAWDVPAGLCDSELTSSVIRKAVDPKQPLRGLLLRGLNKSAFDVYGYDIRKVVVNRLMGIGQRHLALTLAATWLNGSSSLPERDSLGELGPIIDTNALAWTRPKGQLKRYSLPLDRWDPVSEDESHKRDLSELSNQVSELPIYKSELWRRTVRYAVKKLSSLPELDDVVATEALLMHWVFPWTVLQNTPGFDIATFFKEHFPAVQDNPVLMAALDRYSETSV